MRIEPTQNAPNGHQFSHRHLLSRVPEYPPARRGLPLSGIMVPTHRPAGVGSGLALATRLAQVQNATLLVIRSGPATRRALPRVMGQSGSGRIVVINLPADFESLLQSWECNRLTVARLHRSSDLGLKRNLGLLIGRLCGWQSLLFLDDDIRVTPASGTPMVPGSSDPFLRLDDVLADFENSPDLHAAGYFQRDFDDNSVVCHVRRLVGLPQDTFISGGALAVRCAGPLPMFCAAYNEDWLFFLYLMLNGQHAFPSSAVKYVGTVHQDEYYPFTSERARSEELGDLQAEGLFQLAGEHRGDLIASATSVKFWNQAIQQRRAMIVQLMRRLNRFAGQLDDEKFVDAQTSLAAAWSIYRDRAEDLAVQLAEFFEAYLRDQETWARQLDGLTPDSPAAVLTLEQALERLGLQEHVVWDSAPGSHSSARPRSLTL